MMHEGKFREDLYHRLAGCALALPPLSERPGDLPVLTRHFLTTGNKTKQNAPVSEPAIWHWVKHDYWPRHPSLEGNVRQLEFAVQRAVIDGELCADDDHPFPAMLQLSTPLDAQALRGHRRQSSRAFPGQSTRPAPVMTSASCWDRGAIPGMSWQRLT